MPEKLSGLGSVKQRCIYEWLGGKSQNEKTHLKGASWATENKSFSELYRGEKTSQMSNTSLQGQDLEVLKLYMSCILIVSRMGQDPLRMWGVILMKLPLRSRNRLLPYPKVLFVFHLSNNSPFYGKDIGPFQVGQKIGSSHRFRYPGRRKWLQLSGITPLQKNRLIGKWSEHLQIWKAVLFLQ